MNKKTRENPRLNGSGCRDSTAYEAITHITKEEHEMNQRVHKVIELVKEIIAFAGFEMIGRIQIKHKRSGKEFR